MFFYYLIRFILNSGAVRVSVSAQYVMCLCVAGRSLSLILYVCVVRGHELCSLCSVAFWVVERLVTTIQNEAPRPS